MAKILDVSILAQLQEEAPRVVLPSYDMHQAVVKALVMWSSTHPANGVDVNGRTYWVVALQDLQPLVGFAALTPKQIGSACRNFCMVLKREGIGYHVAWSQKQLDILRKAFNVGEQK